MDQKITEKKVPLFFWQFLIQSKMSELGNFVVSPWPSFKSRWLRQDATVPWHQGEAVTIIYSRRYFCQSFGDTAKRWRQSPNHNKWKHGKYTWIVDNPQVKRSRPNPSMTNYLIQISNPKNNGDKLQGQTSCCQFLFNLITSLMQLGMVDFVTIVPTSLINAHVKGH
jgi:hypothetical protein